MMTKFLKDNGKTNFIDQAYQPCKKMNILFLLMLDKFLNQMTIL